MGGPSFTNISFTFWHLQDNARVFACRSWECYSDSLQRRQRTNWNHYLLLPFILWIRRYSSKCDHLLRVEALQQRPWCHSALPSPVHFLLRKSFALAQETFQKSFFAETLHLTIAFNQKQLQNPALSSQCEDLRKTLREPRWSNNLTASWRQHRGFFRRRRRQFLRRPFFQISVTF